MVRVGNFLFRYRNGLFPVIYMLLLFNSHPLMPNYRVAALTGFIVAAFGQSFAVVEIVGFTLKSWCKVASSLTAGIRSTSEIS